MADKIFIQEERKARKPHICSHCGTTIQTNDVYLYIKGIKGKKGFYLNYLCKNCCSDNL